MAVREYKYVSQDKSYFSVSRLLPLYPNPSVAIAVSFLWTVVKKLGSAAAAPSLAFEQLSAGIRPPTGSTAVYSAARPLLSLLSVLLGLIGGRFADARVPIRDTC